MNIDVGRSSFETIPDAISATYDYLQSDFTIMGRSPWLGSGSRIRFRS